VRGVHGPLRPVLVGLFVVGLFGVQLYALGRQVASGYRPFGPPPLRVALSWDMFATRIERCDVRWDPPLPVRGGLDRFSRLARPIEWFPVLDRVASYRRMATGACRLARVPTRISLRCWLPDGTRPEETLPCP
jgi:hypothetical protein